MNIGFLIVSVVACLFSYLAGHRSGFYYAAERFDRLLQQIASDALGKELKRMWEKDKASLGIVTEEPNE